MNAAPPDTDFPYGKFFLVSNVPWDRFVERGEEALIQFSIFTKRGESVDDPETQSCQLYTLLDNVYNQSTLTIDDYTMASCKRELDDFLPPDSSGVYHSFSQYRILIEKD